MSGSVADAFGAQVITVSTGAAAGVRHDRSGALLAERLAQIGLQVAGVMVIPDDRLRIQQAVLQYTDFEPVALLALTGGTGPTRDDLTPDAVIGLLERRFDGIAAAIIEDARAALSRAPLSRVIVGTRGATVVVILPGSPAGVADALSTLEPLLQHLLALVAGRNDPH